MKPWIAMVCCLVFFLTTECSHSKPKTHRKDEDKFQISLQKHEFRPRQGKCDGLCSSSSSCNQSCPWNFRGEIVFTCNQNKWQKTIETCTSLSVDTLFQRIHPAASLSLASSSVFPMSLIGNAAPVHIGNVFQGIQKYCPEDYVCIVDAVKSSAVTSGNIAFIVELLKNISSNLQTSGIHDNVNWKKMKNYGKVANHILGPTAISNWAFIANKNASSDLLESVNSFAKKLQIQGKSESIVDELFIQTKGSRISHSSSEHSLSLSVPRYNATEDVLVVIEIPRQALQELSFNASQAIVVAFPTLGAILKEVHQPNTSLQKPIDDLILSLVLPEGLNEIILTFDKINKSQSTSSQCVSWDPATGQWDESPCTVMSDINSTVKCRCRHTKAVTSFSILMSSKPAKNMILNHITFIGLSISIFSLVLCLVIEAIVWSRVVVTEISYMRHVCIVNIAVSLLTANVWFIIGSNFSANVQEDHKWCVAVTFLCHFFFLSLFFWMLFKALLIVYGILVVFRRMMKSRMMAIGFAIGYGCPLVIAVITVTVTEPGEGYTRKDACWLNWNQTKALFAFAIPALAIVAVNLLVVLAVAINTQRPLIGSSKSQDMAIVFRISKNVAILTPLLGLTWGFGLTTLLEGVHLVFHIIFALLNAFQGFFILLFGTIMDHKIRDALRMRVSSLKGKSRAAEKVSLSPANGSRILNR